MLFSVVVSHWSVTPETAVRFREEQIFFLHHECARKNRNRVHLFERIRHFERQSYDRSAHVECCGRELRMAAVS